MTGPTGFRPRLRANKKSNVSGRFRTLSANMKKTAMKKMKFACNISLLTLVALGQWACAWDPYEHDSDPVRETLELTASASQIALDENNLTATVLTFDWTPARPMSDEYLVSYKTKLDLLTNNFGSATTIETSEDDGIFSRSYTSEQLNNWANERWKVPVNKTFTLAFRVIAEYAGGPTYEMPEVRTVEVTVTPIKVDVFDADKVSLSGTALSSVTEIEKTVENANLYAWYGALSIGELQIPVELEGQTYYIVPSDGNGALRDGELVDVKMQDDPVSWAIPAAGNYRLLIDMENKQVRIYSPATDLKPLSVTFRPNGAEANPETTIEVLDLWAYGAGTGWGVRKLNLKQSLADPQVLIYDAEEHDGTKLSSGLKFCVAQNFTVDEVGYNQNNAYCFTCPLTAEGKRQNLTLVLDKESELHGGADGETRNSYYTIPASDLLIFDLRHNTILARNK